MLTRLRVRNFKRLHDVDIELDRSVVLVGPNNSGKTTALQALALWYIGIRRWNEKRKDTALPKQRPGVTINRRDLISIPVPNANLLWHDLHVRNVEQIQDESTKRKKPRTENVRIEVIVNGITEGREWTCGLEFDYANQESFYCRPLRTEVASTAPRMEVPTDVESVRMAFLPPMSGLAAIEPKWEPGRVNVLIGEGQTAQVLRNLCYQTYSQTESQANWDTIVTEIDRLFGVQLLPPEYIVERGEITMAYRESRGPRLDLSCSGRGLQQSLLLLAHLFANPKTVLLLDEPDAHLEILRQRQTYNLLTDVARRQGSQVIIASHSEVVLNEASDRDVVVAFVGKPHRLNGRPSQILKSLRDIGFDQYLQAEQTGWVLYLEDATDLAILQTFAKTLNHAVAPLLARPFVRYVASNQPQLARDHFFGLREGMGELVGIAIFDRLEKELQSNSPLMELMWRRREIENYFCSEEVLLAYAQHDIPDDLFTEAEHQKRTVAMNEAIAEITDALLKLGKPDPWDSDLKVSDDFLDPVFQLFSRKLGIPLVLRKSQYHVLASLVSPQKIDVEIVVKLDKLLSVARAARPKQA